MKRADRTIIEQLQKQIISLQKREQNLGEQPLTIGLGEMEAAFPEKVFPTGVVLKLISYGAVLE